jgi:serine protease Do
MRPTSRLSLVLVAFLACLLVVGPALARDLPDFTRLVAENGPAVVNISTKQSSSASQRLREFSIPNLPQDSPLQDFFRHFFGEEGEIPEDLFQSRSLGSGFIVSPDGYVITNAHVVESGDEIVVRTSDRREFVATLVGTDKRSDIALLKVDAEGLPVARIGSSKACRSVNGCWRSVRPSASSHPPPPASSAPRAAVCRPRTMCPSFRPMSPSIPATRADRSSI